MTRTNDVLGVEFFSTPDQYYKRTPVKIGEKSIWIREASSKAMLEFVEDSKAYSENPTNKDEPYRITANLLKECVCDKDGRLILTEAPDVKNMPDSVVDKLVREILKLSGKQEIFEVAANLKKEGID